MVDIDDGAEIEGSDFNAVELAADLTMAWLSNPNTRASADDVPGFLKSVHGAVTALGQATAAAPESVKTVPEHIPAVTVRKSLASKDHIISMIDGKPYRTLRRHLSTNGLTPEEYRVRYNLKPDYPMVAETYSEARRAMARKFGLGRKPGQAAPAKKAPANVAATKAGGKMSVTAAKRAAQKHLGGEG